MASDESMTVLSSMQEDEYDDTDDGGCVYDHQHQPNNLSRLSICTSSMYTNEDEEDYVNDEGMRMYMSRLSIGSFDGHDADEEFSDEKEFKGLPELSSDSDKEAGCYSLPATPPRRRSRGGTIVGVVKGYSSENEAQKGLLLRQRMRKNSRRRRVVRERWVESKLNKKDYQENVTSYGNNSFSGESEGGASGGGGGGGGLVVITRPKGGRRSLCMDMEEVKACRDLGFELEHERMLEMPRSSGSTLDTATTSSGGNSPIANWRISSPGDDPRDVKARLKVWAQAVALASASKHTT